MLPFYKMTLICAVVAMTACQSTQSRPLEKRETIDDFETRSLGLRAPVAIATDQAVDLSTLEPELVRMHPTLTPHLDSARTFGKAAQRGFWIGIGGMVVSLAADSQKLVLARTIGNFFWGVGWTTWLGFLGLSEAELDDAYQIYRASPHAGANVRLIPLGSWEF